MIKYLLLKKKDFVVKLIKGMTNYSNNALTLNWSTSTMPLFVKSDIVTSLLNSLDYEFICSKLVGEKAIHLIVDIIFDLYNH